MQKLWILLIGITSHSAFAFQCISSTENKLILKATWSLNHNAVEHVVVMEPQRAALLFQNSRTTTTFNKRMYSFQYPIAFNRTVIPSKTKVTWFEKTFGDPDYPDAYLGNSPIQFYDLPQDREFNAYGVQFLVPKANRDDSYFKARLSVIYHGGNQTAANQMLINDTLVCSGI